MAYQPLGSNGQIVAQVTSQLDTDSLAKAGLMIRGSAAGDSAFVGLFVTPNWGVVMLTRSGDGQYIESSINDASYNIQNGPVWLKLTTTNVGGDENQITAFASLDGITWGEIGQSTLASTTLGSNPLACVAVDSDTDTSASAFSTATFANVSLGATTTTAAAPEIPYNMMAESFSGTDGRVVWQPLVGASAVTIQQSINDAAFQTVATVPGTADTYLPTGLQPNTNYRYQLIAANANGSSPVSPVVSFTTTSEIEQGLYQPTTSGPGSVGSTAMAVTEAPVTVAAASPEQAMLLNSSGVSSYEYTGSIYPIGGFTPADTDAGNVGYYGNSFGYLLDSPSIFSTNEGNIYFNNTAGQVIANPNQRDGSQPVYTLSLTVWQKNNPVDTVTSPAGASNNLYVVEVPNGTAPLEMTATDQTGSPNAAISYTVNGSAASPASGNFANAPVSETLTPGVFKYTITATEGSLSATVVVYVLTVVNSTGDSSAADAAKSPWTGANNNAGNPEVTLKSFMQYDNTAPVAATIDFNIPTSYRSADGKTYDISTHDLPTIAKSMTIDGDSQPGATRTSPNVAVDGDGFDVEADDTNINGLDIINAAAAGVELDESDDSDISNNYIGVKIDGTSKAADNIGISIDDGASDTIDSNLVSGNQTSGIWISGSGSTDNTVSGNDVGIDVNYVTAVPNGQDGILLDTGASENSIENNLISGNTGNGVHLTDSGTSDNTVSSNNIGINGTDDGFIRNQQDGVLIDGGASFNTIDSNTVSGNGANGVHASGSGTNENTISNNQIGTNEDATSAIGNIADGVLIDAGAEFNTIDANTVSGNTGSGVHITGSGTNENAVSNDLIGTNGTGDPNTLWASAIPKTGC
jgi:parallel beta-helix repeat protein